MPPPPIFVNPYFLGQRDPDLRVECELDIDTLVATQRQLEDALTFLPPAMRDSFERRVRNLIRFARGGTS